MPEEEAMILQPVILVSSRQVRCECGAPAVFFLLEEEQSADGTMHDFGYVAECQRCFDAEEGGARV